DVLTTLQEGLSGVRVIQAFRREEQTIVAYQPRSNAQIGAWRKASFVNIRLFTMIPLAQTVALVAVLLVALSLYRDGKITEGTIAAYVLYLVQLFDPIARFSEWLGEFRQGLAALGKVVGLLKAPNAVTERADAVDLRDARLASLRRRSVRLPQEGHLFSGTIADNVRLADPEASDEAVLHALEQIGARERFDALPDGIGTDVQTRGVRLSAGER